MLLRPELEALLGDPARQRLARAQLAQVLAQWRAQAEIAALEAELAGYGCGAQLGSLPRLAALVVPGGSAAPSLAGSFAACFCAALADEPLGLVPLRHHADDVSATLVLARGGDASLTMHAFDGAALGRRPAPRSVSFSPGQTHDVVLAGRANIELVRLAGPGRAGVTLDREVPDLRPGMVSARDGASEALVLREIAGSLVMLRLQRRAARGCVAREFSLADGVLAHQAAASPRDSRLELAAALLGRMGRADSAPLLAELASEEGNPSLRWQALRECIGLDTAQGLAALGVIAARVDDPLAGPAGALRAQLIETYPQLAEAVPCPA